ncbi:4-hydroxy-3-methylbut-2-enyl diphosphate reductase [Baekduia soli]|uniref:4-hydroxy-3-methylbut-2-enyl diphosphate reductase n=1 Tax=Baekduia soli TaxID=496014 RepID=A0A5B8UBL1_9ACTN|nr:4-hydroxy-3-methylbut-2-enyl diphosphate reductase [Baekduia soli]QEC50397.1 4-hydroxy-3-methylbut-2-enyl diphosphate reductase [Baekduia soli]
MSQGAPNPLLILAPMGIEAEAARRGAPWAQVKRFGVGPKRARLAAALAHEANDGPVVIAGVCGALDPRLRAGDVILASELRGPTGTVPCTDPAILAGVLRRAGLTVHVGPIASSQRLVMRDRRRALHRSGALAVDMESSWLAAEAAGTALVTMRVVLDTPDRELHRPWYVARDAILALRTLRRACRLLWQWSEAQLERELVLAAPRASCAGVSRAIDTVERLLREHGAPIYVRRQIVHNAHVVADLEARGAIFVEELDEVPDGATVVFSAHGVSPAVREEARARGLDAIDATCPLVAKVHSEARRYAQAGLDIVLVGHEEHEEVEGTLGEAPEHIQVIASIDEVDALQVADPSRIAYLTQTTLAVDETADVVDALRDRFPELVGPRTDDICYATQNRQDGVRALAETCDRILVVGSSNSSNSRRLVEVAQRAGCPAMLIDHAADLPPEFLAGARRIGITAGASAPERLVQDLVSALEGLGRVTVSEHEVTVEDVRFKPPRRRPREH